MEKAVFQGQGNGNAQPNPTAGEDGQSHTQPETITEERVLEIAREVAQDVSTRVTQSHVSKSENKTKVRLQALEDTLKMITDAGGEVTPEQRQRLQQQIIVDSLTEEEEPGAPPDKPDLSQGQGQEGEQIHPINSVAAMIMDERGIDILQDDPEADLLDMSSPTKFILSLDKAITAKEQRLQNPSEGTEEQTGSPHARIAGAGAGGSTKSLLPDGTPAIDRLDSFYRKQGK